MKRGPKTKPTELQVWQGNPGHKTKAELTDSVKPDVPANLAAPTHLDIEAKKEWKRVAPVLARYGVLTELDTNALALYCQSWSDYLNYTDYIREVGSSYESEGVNGLQIKSRPEVKMRAQAWKEVIRLSAEFGFTPSSRAGLQLSLQ